VEAVALSGRFALAWFFVLAGGAKFADLDAFENAVRDYQLLPGRLVRPLARALPAAEVAAGVLMGAGVGITAVGVLMTVLLVAFALAVAANLLRGRYIDCGCFGGLGSKRISWGAVARNVLLAAIAAAVADAAPAELALPVFRQRITAATTLPPSDALAVLLATIGMLVAVPLVIEGLRVRRRLNSRGAR
jgi:Methylamine utilisation protein MauE